MCRVPTSRYGKDTAQAARSGNPKSTISQSVHKPADTFERPFKEVNYSILFDNSLRVDDLECHDRGGKDIVEL